MNKYLIALNDCKIIDTLLESLVNKVNDAYINKNNLDIDKIRSLMNLLIKNVTLYTCSVDKFSNKEDIKFLIETSEIWNNSQIIEDEALSSLGVAITDISYNQLLAHKEFCKMYGIYNERIGTTWRVLLNLVEYSTDYFAAVRSLVVIVALLQHYVNSLINMDNNITSSESLFFNEYIKSINTYIFNPYSCYFNPDILKNIYYDINMSYTNLYANVLKNPFKALSKNREANLNYLNILEILNYKYINNTECMINHYKKESTNILKNSINISDIDIIKKDSSKQIYNNDQNDDSSSRIEIDEVKIVKHSPITAKTSEEKVEQKTEKEILSNEEEVVSKTLEELLAELNELIGLENIKKDVNEMVNLVKIRNMRKEKKLKISDMSFHLVFTGNPGTGKTTIARILSQIYAKLGIVSKGHLVEVDRSNLIAGYVGQTAIKTKEQIDNAIGGVLFIDEAYSLISDSDSDFADEAISTLLKEMEDNRDDLVVIVAGYPKLMKDFINSNPGLRSRFNKYFEFKDYTLKELIDIFKLYCKKNDFILSKQAEKKLKTYLQKQITENNKEFGNARGVRNIFEKALVNQANRLVNLPGNELNIDKLKELSPEDLIF